jgi:hypothetical protein
MNGVRHLLQLGIPSRFATPGHDLKAAFHGAPVRAAVA